MEIHAQLLADCEVLGRFEHSSLLLNRNAVLPWFILVPDTSLEDVLDLSAAELAGVMGECQQVSRFLKTTLGFPKANVAGLGNVVPQMHLHVIGRRPGDACWPNPVWGHLAVEEAYDPAVIERWTDILSQEYGLADSK